MGLQKETDPIASVHKLAYNPEFAGFITEIGLEKFFVMYMHPNQIHMYKQFLKQTKQQGSISIDATGSLIAKLPKPDGAKNFVFFYIK